MTKVRESSAAEDTEVVELRRRLEEAEETLRAIREGEVDALVVDSPEGEVIYTLTGADYPYRLMIDEMNEGAVSVSPDAFILYSNRNFGSILGLNGTSASGVPFADFIVPEMRERFIEDLQQAREQSVRREYTLSPGNGRVVPVLMSFAKLQPQTNSIGIVITDLTAQKALEEKLERPRFRRVHRGTLINTDHLRKISPLSSKSPTYPRKSMKRARPWLSRPRTTVPHPTKSPASAMRPPPRS